MIQADLDFARRARDEGMQQAVEHADVEVIGWSDVALMFIRKYACEHEYFSPEDVCDAAIAWGMAQPPDKRAWGGPYIKAQRLGWIARSERPYQRRFGHATRSFLWRSLICKVKP